MANHTISEYDLSYVVIRLGGVRVPFLRLNLNIPNLAVGDNIYLGSGFKTWLAEHAEGAVAGSGYFTDQRPVNPLNFSATTLTCDDDSNLIATVGVQTATRWGYVSLELRYNTRGFCLGGLVSGTSFASGEHYALSPVLIFYNEANGKYIAGYTYDSPKFYTSDNPGIVNVNGAPASYLMGRPVEGSNPYITVSAIESLANGVITPTDEISDDPYGEGGFSEGGIGGTGTFSETGDTIGIPGLPALSAVDTGFITLFNPSAAQVKALATYMWSASFDLATFKNIVANPIDCILGLTIVPVNPPNAGSKTVNVGNIPTDVTLPYLSSQYVEVDCGTLNVQEFWGSYLDYSPYTKMSLYLPYIGIVPLDIDDVMNASIAIKYHVDVLSGACVAYVLCNGTQLYTYVGQCSSNVPITSNDFTNTVNGILGIAGSIGKLAADGGASAPTEAAGIAANAINALKPNIQKSGAMSGTGGLMGVQTPYLICQRPRQSVPAFQNEYTGYPANITAKLSDLSGYTEVDSIHLDGLSATQEEQQEIMDLLTSGVII